MDVVSGTDTSTSDGGVDSLLRGIRRLIALADNASDADTIFRALARGLLTVPGAALSAMRVLTSPADTGAVTLAAIMTGTAWPGRRVCPAQVSAVMAKSAACGPVQLT